MRTFRIFNQWRESDSRRWCFVPFSVWASEEFFGFVLFNFCFEFPRTPEARNIQAAMR